MNINELAKEGHDNAVSLGKWETALILPGCLCLIHAVLSATLQGYQEGNPLVYGTCALALEDCRFSEVCDQAGHPEGPGIPGPCKPEGIAVELADVIPQTLADFFGVSLDRLCGREK